MAAEHRWSLAGDPPPVVTAIIALVPFTVDNGATRVVPASHRVWSMVVPQDPDKPFPPARIVSCDAGDVVVFPEALVHSGTRNRSHHPRDSIQVAFRPQLREAQGG